VAGLSREEFKSLLAARGFERCLYTPVPADVDADVALLLVQPPTRFPLRSALFSS